jgi:hypothetical protein
MALTFSKSEHFGAASIALEDGEYSNRNSFAAPESSGGASHHLLHVPFKPTTQSCITSSLRQFSTFSAFSSPFILGFIAGWILTSPTPASLREVALTADGKSFPSGNLFFSKYFEPLPCGKTPTQVVKNGCHFDIVATAWLPPRCIDHDLVKEFRALHPWEYYADRNGTYILSEDPDTLGSRTETIWTTRRWHVAH